MGERLSESHSNEFRQHRRRSEFTESALVPTQPSIQTNESDIKPSSPSTSRQMQQHSKVTSKERRQNDQVGFQHDDPLTISVRIVKLFCLPTCLY